ncbi:Uncharacterised protein [[Eubacterium] contortum]|uniref:Uncharacterized protein n=1 Tax=Faecalicatena contorta TaxID=39482 RepID=A0A174JY74_9FIRM|nr:Uncharacterised protein [[Eubacterium] contortum] [Faecalicatena contorta]
MAGKPVRPRCYRPVFQPVRNVIFPDWMRALSGIVIGLFWMRLSQCCYTTIPHPEEPYYDSGQRPHPFKCNSA